MQNKLEEAILFFKNNLSQLFAQSASSAKGSIIGLDIGSSYVKAVSMEKGTQGQEVSGFACEKVGQDLKGAIKKSLSNLGAAKKELALAISGHGIVLRYVNLPIMSYEDTANSMNFELEKHIPFHKDEVNFDFSILKKNKNTGKMLVLIAAAKKELIEEKIKICKDLGYSIRFIDVGPLAIANYFEYIVGFKEGVVAVINLGAAVTTLDIIEDGILVLSRDIFISGNDFTKKISESFNKNHEEAEELKLSSGDDDLCLVLEPLINNLAGELKVSFDFYETQANRLIDKIFISGGSASLKIVPEIFKQSLGQEVESIGYNPDKLKLKPNLNIEEFKKRFDYFIITLGTVLR